MAGFNMWSYALSNSAMTRTVIVENVGNVIALSDLQLGGSASYTYEEFDWGCKLKYTGVCFDPIRLINVVISVHSISISMHS